MARTPRTTRRQQCPQRPARRTQLLAETLESRRLLASDLIGLGEIDIIAPGHEIDSTEVMAHPLGIGDPNIELPPEIGDFNADGNTDAHDIDLLAEAVRGDSDSDTFDLDGSGSVDKSDMDMLIHNILDTDYGDANLDNIVNGVDYAIWSENQFQTQMGWATGDFNGDGVTDVSDFNVWNGLRDADAPTASQATETPIDLADSQVEIDAGVIDLADSSQGLDDMDRAPQTLSDENPQPIPDLGDFNEDENVDAADIDVLSEAIREDSQDLAFDLDSSDAVDKHDMDMLVRDIIGTEYGDANLDFAVNSIDRAIWEFYRFQPDAGWARGDFNGDGQTDVSDFNFWNGHRDHDQVDAARDNMVRDVIAPTLPSSAAVRSDLSGDGMASATSTGVDDPVSEEPVGNSIGVASTDRLRTPRKPFSASTAAAPYRSSSGAGEQVATNQPRAATIDGIFARFRRLRSLGN